MPEASEICSCASCGVELGPIPEDRGYSQPVSMPVIYCSYDCAGGNQDRGTRKKHLGPGQRGRPVRVYCECAYCRKCYLRERGHMRPTRKSPTPHRYCSSLCRRKYRLYFGRVADYLDMIGVRARRFLSRELERYISEVEDSDRSQVSREVTASAISRGWVDRGPCRGCGTDNGVEAYCEDSNLPLEVQWRCPDCHRTYEALGEMFL